MVILKRIVNVLSYIVYFMIIVYILLLVPMIFKYRPLVVLSGSMEPSLQVGSVIYYKEVAKDEIKEKDIITFETSDKKLVSHRVVKLEEDMFITKGDANNSVDPLKVSYNTIKGKVSKFNVRYLGHYVKFVNDNNIIVIVLAILILVSEFILSNGKTLDIEKIEKGEKDGKE